MSNLDVINDFTIAVTWDEIKTNLTVILISTYFPAKFCHIRSFYFYLWPKTLSFERCRRKSPRNRSGTVLNEMRVVTTIFSTVIAQRRVAINIVLTLFQMAAKFFQHCNDVLR